MLALTISAMSMNDRPPNIGTSRVGGFASSSARMRSGSRVRSGGRATSPYCWSGGPKDMRSKTSKFSTIVSPRTVKHSAASAVLVAAVCG